VEKEIENFRFRQSKLVDAPEDATVADKDFITLDFKGYINGEPFEGGEGKDYPLTIGSKSFIDNFEDQLIGMKIGEEKKVNVTFPEEYHTKELAGKPAEFECTVRSIKHRELPPADDELAKKVSTFETIEELRADVRKNLEETAEHMAVHEQEEKAIELAAENTQVEIPSKLVERRVDSMINEMAMRLMQQGMSLDAYLSYTGTDIMKLRESYREDAKKRTKIDLMLNAIAEKEGIKAETEDIDKEIEGMATAFGSSIKDVRKVLVDEGRLPDLMYTTLLKKTMRFIIDNLAK
jgi:trigger factor